MPPGVTVEGLSWRGFEEQLTPGAGDVVINCALDPRIKQLPYDEAFDFDLRVFRQVAQCGARFFMLSTRKVYGQKHSWGSSEVDPADGQDAYGRNKAVSEAALIRESAGRVWVARVSNVIGFEWPAGKRFSFMASMMAGLKNHREIVFDMTPEQQRDFIPVRYLARAVLHIISQREFGVYNVGSGFPVKCGELAESLIQGFGQGHLVVRDSGKNDQFFLNMEKLNLEFDMGLDKGSLLQYCRHLGAKLANA